jgi:Fungal specific transcription factor domain
MKTEGPYYSPVLMNAMMSHSIRWCKANPTISPLLEPFDGGRQFFDSAVTAIFDDLRQGHSKITTIQTLLLLSAQECGRGNRTQAWLYCGMAIRLVEDMGLGIDGRRYAGSAQLTDEDIEIRNRLYWSTFLWEKILCLYFGRAPVLHNSSVSPPKVICERCPR